LVECQYSADTVQNIATQRPSLVVADFSRLPGEGEMFCHQVTRLFPTPLLLAIVQPEVEAAVAALEQGAAACLKRPVEPRQLAAQITALQRLALTRNQDQDTVVEVGALRIDSGRRQVFAGGRALPLTPTEFRILSCLARTPGRVVPPADVMRECVGLSLSEREAAELLKVHVYRLRRKLRASGAPDEALRSARGFGYLLERRTTEEAASLSRSA
jgi:DNA-binding response OmpR family regulator